MIIYLLKGHNNSEYEPWEWIIKAYLIEEKAYEHLIQIENEQKERIEKFKLLEWKEYSQWVRDNPPKSYAQLDNNIYQHFYVEDLEIEE